MGLRDVAAVSFVPLGSGRNVYSGMWAIGIEGGGVRRSFHRARGFHQLMVLPLLFGGVGLFRSSSSKRRRFPKSAFIRQVAMPCLAPG